jgi:hypothetical protein
MVSNRTLKGPGVCPARPDLLVGLVGAMPVVSAQCQLHGRIAATQASTMKQNVWLLGDHAKIRGLRHERIV